MPGKLEDDLEGFHVFVFFFGFLGFFLLFFIVVAVVFASSLLIVGFVFVFVLFVLVSLLFLFRLEGDGIKRAPEEGGANRPGNCFAVVGPAVGVGANIG